MGVATSKMKAKCYILFLSPERIASLDSVRRNMLQPPCGVSQRDHRAKFSQADRGLSLSCGSLSVSQACA